MENCPGAPMPRFSVGEKVGGSVRGPNFPKYPSVLGRQGTWQVEQPGYQDPFWSVSIELPLRYERAESWLGI